MYFELKAGTNNKYPMEYSDDLYVVISFISVTESRKVASLTEKSAAIFTTQFRHSFRRKTNELYIHSVTVKKPLIFVACTHMIIKLFRNTMHP